MFSYVLRHLISIIYFRGSMDFFSFVRVSNHVQGEKIYSIKKIPIDIHGVHVYMDWIECKCYRKADRKSVV